MKDLLLFMLALLPVLLSGQTICAYPGDANNDGRADYLDLIAVGLSYGQISDPRPNPGNQWQSNCFPAWPGEIPGTGVNIGFADSDGNGQVDSLDVDAIALNYDSLQADAQPLPLPYDPDTLFSSPCAEFLISFQKDEADPQRFFASIEMFVDPTFFPGALGAGMRLSYPSDPQIIVEDSTRVLFIPANTDLMGLGAAPFLTTLERQLPPGIVEFAVAGRGINALHSPRLLAQVQFIITKDVIIRSDTLNFTLVPEAVFVINAAGQRICAVTEVGQIQLVTGTQRVDSRSPWAVFPNPTSDQLYLSGPDVGYCRLWRGGQLVGTYSAGTDKIEMGQLPNGLYFMEISGEGSTFWQKIILQK